MHEWPIDAESRDLNTYIVFKPPYQLFRKI